jgi:hypothetical protein
MKFTAKTAKAIERKPYKLFSKAFLLSVNVGSCFPEHEKYSKIMEAHDGIIQIFTRKLE